MSQAKNLKSLRPNLTESDPWVLIQSSGGDNSPAIWQNQNVGSTWNAKPTLMHSIASNKARTIRRSTITGRIPIIFVENGSSINQGTIPINISIAIPNSVNQAYAYTRLHEFFSALTCVTTENGNNLTENVAYGVASS